MNDLRKTGIDILGDIPWGTHFCQFYETKEDLLELLVPFFKAGLEHNEYCLWIIADPMTVDDALHGLERTVSHFQQYVEKQSIEILPYMNWFMATGKFDAKHISNAWIEKLDEGLARGYDGMRINGNETWLERNGWDNFMEYERGLHKIFKSRRIIGLCTYPLSVADGGMVLDVAHAHEAVIAKRKGHWEILEHPEIKKLKAELQQRGDELEQRVAERTSELAQSIQQLKQEVNERKKAEEQIKRQIELTNEIIDTIPVMSWSILPDGKLEFVNKVWTNYTGLSLAEAIKDPVAVIHPDDLPGVTERWTLNRNAGRFHEDEMRMRRADGAYRWFLVRTEPLRYKDGNVYKWYGVCIDIEDRKNAEERIKQSENLLAEAEKIAHIGSWSLDLRSNTVTWSDELYRMFGIKKSEFDHNLESAFNLIHPLDRDFVGGIVGEAAKTQAPFDFYFHGLMPDKKVRIIHVRGVVMTDAQGNAVRMCGVSQDVTERRQAEDELRLAYQRLSYHVANTPLGVIEWDKDLFITRWSAQAERIFGWKASEAVGKNIYGSDFLLIYEEDKPAVDKIINELTDNLVNRNFSLNRNYRKDGSVIYCEWYNSVLRDDNGNVITMLSLTHDVTDRKNAEEKLNESYQQIRSLTEHLQKIREEERAHIAREIHDELGQQLTVIKMDISWLGKKISAGDEAAKERFRDLVEILDATVQAVRKISYELRPHLLDLGLDDAIKWHLKEFEKRSGIKTSFSSSQEESELDDSIKTGLFRIFQESLTNVARHSGASHVHVELIIASNHIILRINDNGRGFNMNKAAEKQTLGILGMRERAIMMGGNYSIESQRGKGTTVMVIVPYSKTGK